MNSRDKFYGTRFATGLAPVALSAAAVQTGPAIDISEAVAITALLDVYVFATGTVGIQDVQFADDSSFTTNVTTITSDDELLKNDRESDTSAIAQTVLAAVGKRKLSLENRAINGQKWFRVRTVTTGTVSSSAQVIVALDEYKKAIVQA